MSSGGGVTCTLDDCKRTSCSLRLGLQWAVRSCGGCSAARPPPPSVGSITPPPPRETQPPQLLQLPLMGRILLSEPYGAFQSQGQTVRERTEWQVCSGKMRECGDKHVQLVKPSMLNFAKTDAELRPPCALLILSTYRRIKKHLLTNWHAWINHRAVLKGTMNSLSWQNLAIFTEMTDVFRMRKRPPGLSLSEAPSKIQQRTHFVFSTSQYYSSAAIIRLKKKQISITFTLSRCVKWDHHVWGVSAGESSKGLTPPQKMQRYKEKSSL